MTLNRPFSETLPEDETVRSLRRVCDRHFQRIIAGETFEWSKQLPFDLSREIVGSLPSRVFYSVRSPACGAHDHINVVISPDFYRYVTFAAEYWSRLFIGHGSPPLAPSSDNLGVSAMQSGQ